MAAEEVDHLVARRRAGREQLVAGHQDPGRAEPALERGVAPERLLQRPPRQALDRADLGAVHLHREREAAANRAAVELDGARPADAVLAADVRPGQAERVAEEV